MHKTIISDTSCFIVLSNIGELDLLRQMYGQVVTTQDIVAEYGSSLPEWVGVLTPKDILRQRILEIQVDKGEASAIALALEVVDCTLILDDHKARRVAEKLGIEITGTLGVIIKARQKGLFPSIKPYLEKLKQAHSRIAPALEAEALKEAGEA